MTTAAQDEFNELMRDKDREERHPEDRHNDSDLSDPESEGAANDRYEIVDTDDELDIPADMRSNYYMPSHIRSEANTGPKGVIADAQAFEQAKKQARRFTWKKGSSPQQYNVTAYQDDRTLSDEENDSGFMKQWRESRLRELQNAGQRIRSRTNSPSRKIYGSMPAVDGEGYLDAIEKTSSDTTVVVFIYNDQSEISNMVEECMREVAKRNDTVRFVKLHNVDAEMEEEGVPAVLAYKGGDKFAGLVPLLNELPDDSELSAVSLETAFRRHRIL
ncbi:thioredoxin-like protein [Macroventuria anomochaeta]|uniref:Thioredoxin-like protein n=1 Tax=Macroventuria anomochaeta TaxID=301207 RepID=A0ACB6RZJ6_9PLEO|nr:thioredoxin-like protein [Macroventuria anomochaeta]KAF2627441.1 thioredoxin-like protein [Macroventuria anomochaeta]